jgi:AcrR family transcriptional regulator
MTSFLTSEPLDATAANSKAPAKNATLGGGGGKATNGTKTKGALTQGNILRTALAFASEFGLGGVSIGSLAERLAMSKSGLFAHFSSKENLQRAILEEAIARFSQGVVQKALKEPRGEPRVRALFRLWLRWSKAEFMPGGCIFVAAAVELDDQPGPLLELLREAQMRWFETLSGAAKLAMREGHFRSDLDTDLFAHEMYALAYGHHFVARLLKMPFAEERTMQSFERLLQDAKMQVDRRSPVDEGTRTVSRTKAVRTNARTARAQAKQVAP